ncbi:MAG: hypothetical protein M3365_00655 [Gemmatimonadota bacterium]|nr:hypothetical protein [Gemmatimonadota bacterium]
MTRSAANFLWSLLAIAASGCATSGSSPADRPVQPRLPDIPAPTSATGPWIFAHTPGTRAYRISRNATIEGLADSAVRRETVSSHTHQILTLEGTGEELSFRAVVDTFALITQGVVGPPQSIELPIELSGNTGPAGVRVESPATEHCSAIRATIVTDLYNLLVPFPSPLTRGTVWRDSISASGCQAGIPTAATTRRIFTVIGEVNHFGRGLVLVQRADSVTARGEGAYGQHRMRVDGAGTGGARYYLDTASGEVSQLTTVQQTRITVTTSGRVHTFVQTTSQDFVRVP